MKKNILLAIALLLSSAGLTKAQLLNEGFEGEVFPPEGWTIIPTTTPGVTNHWERQSKNSGNELSGKAWIEITSNKEPAKEELIVTPELQLPSDEVYGLQFKWWAQKIGFDGNQCDFMIKVQEKGSSEWNTIWGIKNKEQVEASGVIFPWKQWTVYSPCIDLSAWKGKSVKFAFCYTSIDQATLGWIKLDDIIVDRYVAPTPEVSGSTSYIFENVYVGVKKQAVLTLKNSGKDVLKVTGISGLDGTDFSTSLATEKDKIALRTDEEAKYYVFYNPTVTGKGSATLTIETNGGKLNVALSGTKTMLPEGYTLESFESGTMPPLGWTNTGWNLSKSIVISGDYSVSSGILEECTLTSPRLDLSAGNHKVIFDFIEDLIDETGTAVPVNDFTLELKVNDKGWEEIWFAKDLIFQEIIRVSVDLRANSNNCYLRWRYTGDFSGGFESIVSDIYFDDIVLPPLYKTGELLAASNPTPASGSQNMEYAGITLTWEGVLFADGYKLYIGTDENNPTSLVNGEALTETSYATGALTPATTYYWKVVPFNASTEVSDVPVWSFTTMADQTITTFPYSMNFDDCTTSLPLGWTAAGDGKGWNVNEYSPFEGKNSCSVFINTSTRGEATLQTPLIQLPEDRFIAAFWWAKNMPIRLKKQTEGDQPKGEDNGNDILTFEIKEVDGEWTELARTFEEEYWTQAIISLDKYANKKVWLRWKYAAENGYAAEAGGSLDNFYIGEEGGLNIRNMQGDQIDIRPVVTKTTIYIEGAAPDMNAILYDIAGNAVRKVTNTDRINIASLPKGMYILSVHQDNRVYNTRIIKK